MNRPGDVWIDVPDASFRTKASGAYKFVFPAPSMYGVSYRVVGEGVQTGKVGLTARPQEITLALAGETASSPFTEVTAGAPFTVVADATPAARSALGTPPVFAGRTITLQERAGNQWQTIATKPGRRRGAGELRPGRAGQRAAGAARAAGAVDAGQRPDRLVRLVPGVLHDRAAAPRRRARARPRASRRR